MTPRPFIRVFRRTLAVALGLWASARLPAETGESEPPRSEITDDTVQPAVAEAPIETTTPDALDAALAALRARGFAAERERLARPLIEAAVRAFDPMGTVIIEGETPDAPKIETSESDAAGVELEELPRKLWRVRATAIEKGTGEHLLKKLEEAGNAGAVGIVLDLRAASGNSVAEAARIAERFAAPGAPLFEYRDPAGRVLESFSAASDPRNRIPLPPTVVLIGSETRGAAEVLAAALEHARGVITAGRPAAGDPLLRETISAGNGLFLHLATRRLVIPNGETYDAFHRLAPRWPLPANSPPLPPEKDDNGDTLDRRKTLAEEAEHRALRDRVRGDGDLRAAADLLLGLSAIKKVK